MKKLKRFSDSVKIGLFLLMLYGWFFMPAILKGYDDMAIIQTPFLMKATLFSDDAGPTKTIKYDQIGLLEEADIDPTFLSTLLDDIKVKVSANDTTADFLKNKLVANEDGSIVFTEINDGLNETLKAQAFGDHKVKTTVNDVIAQYLDDKFVGGLNTDINVVGPPGTNQHLTIDALDRKVMITGGDTTERVLNTKLTTSIGIGKAIVNPFADETLDIHLNNFAGLTGLNITSLNAADILIPIQASTDSTDIERLNWLNWNWAQIGTDYGEVIVGFRHDLTIPQIHKFPFTGYYHFAIDIQMHAEWQIMQPTTPVDTFEFDGIVITYTDADGVHSLETTPYELLTIGQKAGCPVSCCCTVNGDYREYTIHINGYAHLNMNSALSVVINFPANIFLHNIINLNWGFNYLCQTLGNWY